MTGPSTPNAIQVGHSLIIVAKSSGGYLAIPCEVEEASHHHFRVRCRSVIPRRTLFPGQEVKVRPADDDSAIAMPCKYLRGNEDTTTMLVISMPAGEWRSNRRAFVRASLELPCSVTRGDEPPVPGRTIDLSGGGALVELSRAAFVVGELVRFEMNVPAEQGGALVQIETRIVRNDLRGPTSYGLQFIKARTRDHNLVCKMVIVKQFEERRAALRDLTERSENR